MNQKDLIDQIANIVGESKITVETILKTAADVIQAELFDGGEVTLPGLGKFTVKTRSGHKGRHPATGEEMDIPAKRVPKFSAAKALKDAVNG